MAANAHVSLKVLENAQQADVLNMLALDFFQSSDEFERIEHRTRGIVLYHIMTRPNAIAYCSLITLVELYVIGA